MDASHFTRDNLGGVVPALVLPDEPLPVRFMNTIWADTSGVHDVLESPAALDFWLAAVVGDDLGAADPPEFADALLLRDALRRVAALVTEDSRAAAQAPVDLEAAVAAVNAAAAVAPQLHLVLRDGHLAAEEVASGSVIRTALASIAREAVELVTGPAAGRLRACYAPGCVLYFVKAHPRREWCSDGCGNRVRAARHYQRTKASGRDQSGTIA
ncbi:ABATE domain-containing protein [Mycobacterium sp. M26]|uniref:CGNR zinc finger domain-containing protein n=1 Tax=Mycobacterium sp. M26 TaxID=1762962 RepID=UPI0009EC22AD|nr:ABATE domain-containing protein [Mycobacterium sp. M26]